MVTCTLEIGDRVVLRSEGGTPEVEYVLFDPGEIVLSATEPGIVREVGYTTTADDALRKLDLMGVTMKLALDAAAAMAPELVLTYARGAAVRRVAPVLGACEMFEGQVYDAELRSYVGAWLDLATLALDLEIPRATSLLQALHLVALLNEVDRKSAVVLTTREHSLERRPGQRSYKRFSLDRAGDLPAAIRALAGRARQTPPMDEGPDRIALLEALAARRATCTEPSARERIEVMERAMEVRQRPERGPLSDPDLWAIEERLSAGDAVGVVEHLDVIERSRGRQPTTAYLRARAALITGREQPRAVAERAAALALSMAAFVELELLAAEAWAQAGELRRAVPFARQIVGNARAHAELRARAAQIVDAAERAGVANSIPPPNGAAAAAAKRSTRPPPPPPPEEAFTFESHREEIEPLTRNASQRPPRVSRPPPARLEPPPLPNLTPPQPRALETLPERQRATTLDASPGPAPAPRRRPGTVMGIGASIPAGDDDDWMPPILMPTPTPGGAGPRPARQRAVTSRPPAMAPVSPTAPPPSPKAWPIADLDDGGARETPTSGRSRTARGFPTAPEPAKPRAPGTLPPPRASQVPPRAAPSPSAPPPSVSDFMRGASQPPFRNDSPAAHLHIPKAPPLMIDPNVPELAHALSMPPGLEGAQRAAGTFPTSVIDARVQFTYLSRELGLDYLTHGIELRNDLESIEAMQRTLLERYPARTLANADEALDVRRHGAFLSEIFARLFGAFWVDIGPSDLGYWAMVIPPGTRVWPFGRILRLIVMQNKERDLVSYFLELQGRARP